MFSTTSKGKPFYRLPSALAEKAAEKQALAFSLDWESISKALGDLHFCSVLKGKLPNLRLLGSQGKMAKFEQCGTNHVSTSVQALTKPGNCLLALVWIGVHSRHLPQLFLVI